jgi:hypothetical protein
MAKNRKKSQTLRMTARVDFFTPSERWERLKAEKPQTLEGAFSRQRSVVRKLAES